MGVTCIFFIKELSIVSDIMSTMENRIINIFGGKALDHWSVVCKLYKPPPKMPVELIKNSGRGESMYLLSFSSKPNHVYSIIDEKIVMEADNAFVELIAKIKNIWVQRQMAKIDGYNFEIGDYNVRYGNLNVGSHSKGLIVEVEHTKSTSVTESSDLLIEFIDYLIPRELYNNYKLELKRPDNGYDYTIVGLSQTKEHDDLSKKYKNTINQSIIPNAKMEIDNPTDSINTNTINSSSNELLNSSSPYSNTTFNQSSVMGTPGSLGSTIISDIVNETNKYVSTESSIAVDTPMSTTNNSISLTTVSSLNNTNTLSSIATKSNTNINTPSSLNANSLTSVNSTNLATAGSSTIKVSTPLSTTQNATTKLTTVTNISIPAVAATNTVAPIAPIPTVAPLVTPNQLTALAGLDINSFAFNAAAAAAVAANSLKATDNTNYDINLQPSIDSISALNTNSISALNTNSPSTDVPTAPFIFNPTNLLNPTTLSANTKTINPLPVMLNNSNAIAMTNKSIPNVFSKAKQNSLLSTIKKKEPLLNQPLSSSQISNFIQSSAPSLTTSATSIKTIPPNSNILINQSLLPTLNINNSITDIKEGKEIKEIKERANYNFVFTSRHTAYQYINLLRSEKIL